MVNLHIFLFKCTNMNHKCKREKEAYGGFCNAVGKRIHKRILSNVYDEHVLNYIHSTELYIILNIVAIYHLGLSVAATSHLSFSNPRQTSFSTDTRAHKPWLILQLTRSRRPERSELGTEGLADLLNREHHGGSNGGVSHGPQGPAAPGKSAPGAEQAGQKGKDAEASLACSDVTLMTSPGAW